MMCHLGVRWGFFNVALIFDLKWMTVARTRFYINSYVSLDYCPLRFPFSLKDNVSVENKIGITARVPTGCRWEN